MLKCYRVWYKTIVKGYHISTEVEKIIQEEEPINEEIAITWQNLDKMYKKYSLCFGFNIWNFKRGRLVSFFNATLRNRKTWDIKEWKESELNITLKIEYNEYTPTIDEVLKWYDGDKAIQYLVERGLSVINK